MKTTFDSETAFNAKAQRCQDTSMGARSAKPDGPRPVPGRSAPPTKKASENSTRFPQTGVLRAGTARGPTTALPRPSALWRLGALALHSVCLGVLVCALGLSALAAPDAPIPLDQLGAVAGQQYQGGGLAVSATPDGAQLRCVFQRLTGRVTPEGLWLESTEPGGGQLRLRATAIGREVVESDRFLALSAGRARHSVRAVSGAWEVLPPSRRAEDCAPYLRAPCPPARPAPSGAAYSDRVLNPGAMPLLPELEDNVWGLTCYNDVAPAGAVGPLLWDNQTLPRTGSVSVQDGRVQFRRPGLVEEYSVSMDGVRQDFVVLERPPLNPQPSTFNPEPGMLRVELELTGARAEALPNGVRLTLDGSGRELTYSRLRVTDATGRELPARMEVQETSAFSLQPFI